MEPKKEKKILKLSHPSRQAVHIWILTIDDGLILPPTSLFKIPPKSFISLAILNLYTLTSSQKNNIKAIPPLAKRENKNDISLRWFFDTNQHSFHKRLLDLVSMLSSYQAKPLFF